MYRHLVCSIAVLSTFTFGAGCATHSDLAVTDEAMRFWLEPSHTQIKVGETSTITPRSANIIGKDAKLKWSVSNGAKLDTVDDGRVAQVTCDKPGVYTVAATLYVEGKKRETQTVDLLVAPIS